MSEQQHTPMSAARTLNLTSFDVTAYLSSTAYLQDMQR